MSHHYGMDQEHLSGDTLLGLSDLLQPPTSRMLHMPARGFGCLGGTLDSPESSLSEDGHLLHPQPILPPLQAIPGFAPATTAEPQYAATPRKRRAVGDLDTPQSAMADRPGSARVGFEPHMHDTWHVTYDQHMNEIRPLFQVEVDKGFKKAKDDFWICQKKNHFQVTTVVNFGTEPAYVAAREGMLKVTGVFVVMHGIKVENPSVQVALEQSQADRTKRAFDPVRVEFEPNTASCSSTTGRLHFSETTANNMRKRGKPNPEQRFFALVVSLCVYAGGKYYTVASYVSDNIVVRASNPGQFANESATWYKGHTENSITFEGSVGINTETPDEALCIHGNIRMSGSILQPSDRRLKHSFDEANTAEQLETLRRLRLYRYSLDEEWARQIGSEDGTDFGVIAQELRDILPDAVKETTTHIKLDSGKTVENLVVVNKERLFMENLGAVQELCKITDQLEETVRAVNTENHKFRRAMRRASSLLELKAELGMPETDQDEDDDNDGGKETGRASAPSPALSRTTSASSLVNSVPATITTATKTTSWGTMALLCVIAMLLLANLWCFWQSNSHGARVLELLARSAGNATAPLAGCFDEGLSERVSEWMVSASATDL
eukprot:m.25675 g.25675  ORF g.25675 m.25675 type:complete len:609 (+) comp4464_c0_seq2:3-1829(+)